MKERERILNEIEKISDYMMFSTDMQAGYNLAIEKVKEIIAAEDDIESIRRKMSSLFGDVMITQLAQAGYHQALDRIRVIVDGGKAEDYKCKKERMERCQDCACLVRGDYGDWVCDERERNVITISEDECNC
jgi:hypothetical protein